MSSAIDVLRRRHRVAARHRRPSVVAPRVRRAVAVVTTGALVTFAAGAGSAAAAPERVLQVVQVQMGPDGSLTGISSREVRRAQGGDASVTEQEFDPTRTADDIPVRVGVQWRMGEEAGTDLRDAVGRSGRITIDVSVQNRTVRPEEISYDADGTSRSSYALVGVPLTVVASVDLGEGALGRVVTSDDATPEDVTNGVLGTGPGGTSQVQWATMLAPPRLASSATFRLVVETADFQVPAFDLDVQPGLVTDPSVQQLLRAAFSDSESSVLTLQAETINLIGNVSSVLVDANDTLASVRESLDETAGTLGDRTISNLQASQGDAAASIRGLSSALTSLSQRVEAALRQGNSGILAQLGTTIDDLKASLGDPGRARVPNLPVPAGCAVPSIGAGSRQASLFEQLALVGAQLDALSQATVNCAADVQAGLDAAVGPQVDLGDPESLRQCFEPRFARTAICTLVAARIDLVEQAGVVTALKGSLLEGIDTASVARLQQRVDELARVVLAIQQLSSSLGEDGPATGDVTERLEQLRETLAGLDTALGGFSVGGLVSSLARIQGIASRQVAVLGDDELYRRAAEQLSALAGLAQIACPAQLPQEPEDPEPVDPDPVDPAPDGNGNGGGQAPGGGQTPADQTPADQTPADQGPGGADGADGGGAVVAPRAPFGAAVVPTVVDIDALLDGLDGGALADACEALTGSGDLQAVLGQVQGLREAWQDVQTLASVQGAGQLQSDLQSFRRDIGVALDAVNQLLAADGSSPVATLEASLESLAGAIDGVYAAPDEDEDVPTVDEQCVPTGAGAGPLNQVQESLAVVECRTSALADVVDGFDDDYQQSLRATGGVLGERIAATERARDDAADKVQDLSTRLGDQIQRNADQLRSRSQEQIEATRATLDQQFRLFGQRLTGTTEEVLNDITASTSSSVRNLEAAGTQLQQSLQAVLIDLGTRNDGGTGILGSLTASAISTQAGASQVGAATSTARSFGQVRSGGLEDAYLQRAQMSRSLQLQQEFPAFGIELPEGSRVLTVFSFTLAGGEE